jgi:hypothetical protein
MAFCIFCGKALSGKLSEAVPAPAATPLPAGTSAQAQLQPALAVTCLNCGRTDPLNKEFCIYCGAKAATAAVLRASPNTSGVRMQSEINALEQDIRLQTAEPHHKPPSTILPGILGIVGGLVLGAGLALPAKYFLEPKVVEGAWPTSGLVIYADKPAQVLLQSADEKIFRTAMTSPIKAKAKGLSSFAMGDLRPGKYEVTITSHDGKAHKEPVAVEPGHPTVVGYPDELHL